MLVLYLVADNAAMKEMYVAAAAAYVAKPRRERDAGFDLFSAETMAAECGIVYKVPQSCKAAVYDPMIGGFRAYWMLPRSSISKTPLRMANSVGLIDAGYRGPLIAMVHNITDTAFPIHLGDRYFQIAGPELLPFERIEVVDEIPGGATLRGEGGFGSTGVSGVADFNCAVNRGVDYIR